MYAVMVVADKHKDEEKQRLEALFRSLITKVAQNRDRRAKCRKHIRHPAKRQTGRLPG